MNNSRKIRDVALIVACAAVGATAWATTESLSNSTYVPGPSVPPETSAPALQTQPLVTPAAPADPMPSNERVAAPSEPAAAPAAEPRVVAPVAEPRVAQPSITVEEKRLTLDERIQADVMDKLAAAPNITGKIGVVSQGAVVTLTGYTVTAGQAYRAGRHAGSVQGVKYVQNEIRPRIGGSI